MSPTMRDDPMESELEEIDFSEQQYMDPSVFAHKNCNTLDKDLQGLDISDEIKNVANEIFVEIGKPVYRKGNRKLLIYACLSAAFQRLKLNFTPEMLASIVDIEKKYIPRAAQILFKRGYKEHLKDKTAEEFIHFFLNNSHLNAIDRQPILQILRNIEGRIQMNTYPQEIALGLLNYYFQINGVYLDQNDFIAVSTASLYKKIEEVKIHIISLETTSY